MPAGTDRPATRRGPGVDYAGITPAQAIALQRRLADRVVTENRIGRVRRVAGLDVGFEQDGRITRAAVVVLSYPDLLVVEERVARRKTGFPYVPGLLSFRELPALVPAVGALRRRPDLLLCDGQGYAHPRRFGIACHLGVLLNIPSIGIAKTRLIGEHGAVPDQRGGWTPLRDGAETIGAVLRSRQGVKPVYVSIGHRVDLDSAVAYAMACTGRYRLPDPIRMADRLASRG